MKDKEKQGELDHRGIENLFLYAPASASTLVLVPLALIFATLCGRNFHRQQMTSLTVTEVFAVSVTSWS